MSRGLSRRELLRGAAAALGASAAAPFAAACRPRSRFTAFESDVLVIGSGFAGVFVAQQLLAAGRSVRMLEAGPHLSAGDHPDGERRLFPIANVGPDAYQVVGSRTIGVGGTSRKWGGALLRLAPEELRTRSRHGYGADWPLDAAALEPWWCEAAKRLFATGTTYRADAEPARCAYPDESMDPSSPGDFALAGGKVERFFRYAGSVRPGTGEPVRLAEVEIPALLEQRNFELLAETPALRIAVDANGVAESVEARTRGGEMRRYRAARIVVAAGGFECARLLLASATPEHPHGLGNASGALGSYFFAHPVKRIRHDRPAGDRLPLGYFRAVSAAESLRDEGLLGCGHKIWVFEREVSLNVQPEGEPLAENRLRWSKTARDPFDRPALELDYRFSELEKRTLARGEAIAGELAAALGLPASTAAPEFLDRKHPTGLCRMAARAEDGVVDADLKVFGTRNLHVVGAPVFPSNGIANPTLTVAALALRLGEHLAARSVS